MSPTTSVVFGYIFTASLYLGYWIAQRNKLRALKSQSQKDKAA